MSAEKEFFEKAKAAEGIYKTFPVSAPPPATTERQTAEDIASIRENISTITSIVGFYFVLTIVGLVIGLVVFLARR